MEEIKNAVKNALELYAETSGLSLREVGKMFQDSEQTRQNIYLLVALQASGGAY